MKMTTTQLKYAEARHELELMNFKRSGFPSITRCYPSVIDLAHRGCLELPDGWIITPVREAVERLHKIDKLANMSEKDRADTIKKMLVEKGIES